MTITTPDPIAAAYRLVRDAHGTLGAILYLLAEADADGQGDAVRHRLALELDLDHDPGDPPPEPWPAGQPLHEATTEADPTSSLTDTRFDAQDSRIIGTPDSEAPPT